MSAPAPLLTSDRVRGPDLAPAHPHLGGLGGLRLLLLLVELLDGLDLLLQLHPPATRNTISSGTRVSHYQEEGLPVAFSADPGEYISCQKIYDRRRMFLICWCQPGRVLAAAEDWLCLSPSLFMSKLGPNLHTRTTSSRPQTVILADNGREHFFVLFRGMGERGEHSAIIVTNETHSEFQLSEPPGLEAVNQQNRGDSTNQGRALINSLYCRHLLRKTIQKVML